MASSPTIEEFFEEFVWLRRYEICSSQNCSPLAFSIAMSHRKSIFLRGENSMGRRIRCGWSSFRDVLRRHQCVLFQFCLIIFTYSNSLPLELRFVPSSIRHNLVTSSEFRRGLGYILVTLIRSHYSSNSNGVTWYTLSPSA